MRSAETKLSVMEDCDLNDREFKTAVVKKLNQTNSKRQIDELSKKINEQMEYFTEEIENYG